MSENTTFDAEVVSGEIKLGDIAQKETSSCLVQPAREAFALQEKSIPSLHIRANGVPDF